MYAISTRADHLLKSWRWLLLCMVFAALADIDFLPAFFGNLKLANRFHRQVTHSLLFAVLILGAAFGVLRMIRNPRPARNSIVLFCCALSHLILDLLGADLRPPVGVPLLWPLLRRSFKPPVEIFTNLYKETYAEIFSSHNLGVIAHEVLLFGAILFLIIVLKIRYGAKARVASQCQPLSDETPEEVL